MATGGATATGLNELRAAIDRLPADVTAALKSVASETAARCQTRAKEILRSKLKTSAHALVDGIVIIDDSDNQRYIVVSTRPPDQPTNLPDWTERGTRFMAARPYIRPAGDAEVERYQRDSLQVVEGIAERLGQV